MRIGVVIGWPITHSKSPAMHGAAFRALGLDAAFVALAVPPAALAHAVAGLATAGDILGASVTVPHKEAVVAMCSRLVAPADRIGAVNCLVFEGGAIVGHNTDAGGFVDALGDAGVACAGRRAVVLGGGGAARAVHAGLIDAGAEVRVVARRPEAVTWTAAARWEGDVLAGAELVVDATSSALDPAMEREVVASLSLGSLPPGAVVASLVYHRVPLLLEQAAARGLVTVDGKGMLVHQGARAFQLWLHRPAPIDVMKAAIA
jgi:shikimate dehydrogenase